MATIKEITAKYSKIHDELVAEFYPLKRAGLVDEELQAVFDASHLENELAKQAELKLASDYVEPKPPLVFEPPKTGIPEKVEYIEEYLKELERRM